ncbi:MAG: tRNA epoxyqueuosine(34) reductase QueG [Lactobacillus sp.]|jgi:epoxyqueuosine reductase|nr:tRNA epoxyqueuosine(34) reductase QueG [Lactobacillus sp.]
MADKFDLKAQIIATSQRLGIDKIGFTTAADFEYMRPSLVAQKADGHTTGFEHQNLDERLNPSLIFDQPKSIIAIALAYPSRMTDRPERTKAKRGQFARASWGSDYHFILRDKMAALVTEIEQLVAPTESIRFKPMVDTGELMDVVVAQRAGLGFIGKNGLLITPEFGSFVYLGEIITNLELAPDTPMACQCGDCRRCVDYCPPQALMGNGQLNGQRCLSYQTQTKDLMAPEFRPLIKNVIYGCDICQLVCPFNKGKNFHRHAAMEPDPEQVMPELQPMLDLSNRDFKTRFGEMAGSWRGKKPLQRNAIIALANQKDQSALPNLMQVVTADPRPMIRATAAYAIGQITKFHNDATLDFLQQAYDQEVAQATPAAYLAEFTQAIAAIAAL